MQKWKQYCILFLGFLFQSFWLLLFSQLDITEKKENKQKDKGGGSSVLPYKDIKLMKWKKISVFIFFIFCNTWAFAWFSYGADWLFLDARGIILNFPHILQKLLKACVQWGSYVLIYWAVMQSSYFPRAVKWWILIISFLLGNVLLYYGIYF